MMRPPPRNARLLAALDRASQRIAASVTVMGMAEETCLLARASIARSRRLLDQVEQPRSAARRESGRSEHDTVR